MSVWPLLHHTGKRIGYARVSTPDQKLDMQIDALNAVNCDHIFSDHGVSGAKARRPGLDETLSLLQPGDALVVLKLDRLGRSVLHLADLLTRLRNEEIHFCSIAEGINTTTPGGKLIYHIFSAIAEFQRDLIRENTICGLNAARARGKRLGRPPVMEITTVLAAHSIIEQQGVSVSEVARQFKVSRSTLSRSIARMTVASYGAG